MTIDRYLEEIQKQKKSPSIPLLCEGCEAKEEIVDYCLEKNIPVVPGCITPSEVAQAVKRNLEVVKFFPAEQAGGLPMLKAMAAPYTTMKFMPTGGISAKNLAEYLSFKKIIACGGSWMVKADLIDAGNYDKIVELTKEAVELVKSARA